MKKEDMKKMADGLDSCPDTCNPESKTVSKKMNDCVNGLNNCQQE